MNFFPEIEGADRFKGVEGANGVPYNLEELVMRVARILGDGEAFYHILSRVVDRRLILNDAEKERFRKLMRSVEAFSGCQVLAWSCLDNHWHICLRVPEPEPVSDHELIRRLACLYEKPVVSMIAQQLDSLRQTGARAMCGAQWKGLFTARKLQRLPISPASAC